MSDEDIDIDTQWTPAARARFLERGEELVAALRAHLELVGSMSGRASEQSARFDSGRRLDRAALDFNDAEFDWAGTNSLRLDDYEEDFDDEDDEDEDFDGMILTLIGRWDFEIEDGDVLMAAGREAIRRSDCWPHETEEEARETVAHAALAAGMVYQANGWDAPKEVPGLQATGGFSRWIVHDDRSWRPSDDEGDPFAIDREYE